MFFVLKRREFGLILVLAFFFVQIEASLFLKACKEVVTGMPLPTLH
jgi:hypothetical protein